MSALLVICLLVVASHCATLKRNPKETASTTLRLTAQRNDTGYWTAKFGIYQMTVEHKHFNPPKENDTEDGTWTLKVKHTSTVFEDKTDEDKDRTYSILHHLNQFNNNNSETTSLTQETPTFDTETEIPTTPPSTTTSEEPFIVGIQFNEEPPLPNNAEITSLTNDEEEEVPADYEEPFVASNAEPLVSRIEEPKDVVPDEAEQFLGKEEEPTFSTVVEQQPLPSYAQDLLTNLLTLETNSSSEQKTVGNPYNGGKVEEAETSDMNRMRNEEREHLLAEEERRLIMERYPRSRSLGYEFRELELETKGYNYYPEVGWVKLNTAHWQWEQARRACEGDGGHLAIPDTLHKIRAFTRILKNNTYIIERAVLKNQVFVGVYDPNSNRQFTTVKGEPFVAESVSIWFPNEPNDAHPGENCITLHLEGKLRDVPCFFNLPFLCQID